MIPEPATWLIESMTQTAGQIVTIEKPMDFPLQAGQINVDNYRAYAQQYQATDVVPPPEEFTVKSTTFGNSSIPKDQYIQGAGEISIDTGYAAMGATASMLVGQPSPPQGYIFLTVGGGQYL